MYNKINEIKLKKKFNKKADVSSLVVWIVAFFFILFVMIIFLGFTLIVYGDKKISNNREISFKEKQISNLEKKEFLVFLQKEININSNKERVIDAIKRSLDPFFNIMNDKNENFVKTFGFKALSNQDDSLYDQMLARGFDENDWDSFLMAMENIQDGNRVKEIINVLNEICDNNAWNSYLLELPYGIVTKEGLKLKSAIGEEVYYENEDNELLYTPVIYFTFNYRGETIELKFRKSLDCENL